MFSNSDKHSYITFCFFVDIPGSRELKCTISNCSSSESFVFKVSRELGSGNFEPMGHVVQSCKCSSIRCSLSNSSNLVQPFTTGNKKYPGGACYCCKKTPGNGSHKAKRIGYDGDHAACCHTMGIGVSIIWYIIFSPDFSYVNLMLVCMIFQPNIAFMDSIAMMHLLGVIDMHDTTDGFSFWNCFI